jgi:transcriptional regulator with XRE-family HTH domain
MGSSAIHRPAYRKFCRALRALRAEAGLTQRQLAKALEQSPSYVHKSETGERRVDPVEFAEWCKALKLDPGETLREVLSG